MLEAEFCSKISVTIYQSTYGNIPEDLTPQQHCCENMKALVALGNVYISWTERDVFLLIQQNHTLTVIIIITVIIVIIVVVACSYTVLLAVQHFYNIMIGFQIAEGKMAAIKSSLERI
jgi:hypothetical protein